MKAFFITLIAALSLVSTVYAVPITLTDTTQFTATGTLATEDLKAFGTGTVNKLDGTGDFVTWTHSFTFAPPAEQIMLGTLTLSLYDDEVDRLLNPFSWELGIGFAEDGQWDIGAVDTGLYQYGLDVSALKDGEFEVTVASLLGDFYIVQSDLTVTYEPVPEPSTILLLGVGLLGAGVFTRRRKTSAH